MPKAKLTFADIGAGIVYDCRECDCGTCLTEVV